MKGDLAKRTGNRTPCVEYGNMHNNIWNMMPVFQKQMPLLDMAKVTKMNFFSTKIYHAFVFSHRKLHYCRTVE